MFKKSFLTALLFLMLTVSSISEETPNTVEIEELSPIAKCDVQYNTCTTKCGVSLPNTCLDQCQIIAEKCYDIATSETVDIPPIDYQEESESEAISPTEGRENEIE